MDTWRRGSIKSTTFFKRLSFRRHKKLGNQVIILNQNSQTLENSGQYKREPLRDLKDKSEYLLCKSEQNLAQAQAPPKPPRLYLDSSSCPNIIDHTESHSTAISFSSATPQYHKATQTHVTNSHTDQATDWGTSETGSDLFLSFKVDLGLSLLEDVLQTLRKQNPRDYAA
ncbi:uncharacterized protein C15orf62 homolog, mitochondrial [Pelodiscus sinensis]|uniref:Chromosome 15 open reading frame 62 n=1 Tax=Pelodiscus sinensis TaxID=13735 RepID=K7EZY4_PELSI|nr:uncharacterized protein C15orf62 homolog, mitochondrial [Pelodiscus sinensis]XP_025043327.1 uncharacterized protein C15orf62 homolog, mitochondrial [Pelodiscus sinensis]|eukprot:XP_014431805.1 uncharacterized protein C15orf62 homolog, mitochondrial [Pelodiscus sinensis]